VGRKILSKKRKHLLEKNIIKIINKGEIRVYLIKSQLYKLRNNKKRRRLGFLRKKREKE